MTLLRVAGGHIFTGISAKNGYQIQEEQPVVISESTSSTGFPRRKLGKNKVTTIVVTFSCASEAETSANLAALQSSNGQVQFDYYSPLYDTIRRAYFTVYADPVDIIRTDGEKLYNTWKVTLEQSNTVSKAVTITRTVSAYPSSHVTANWSYPTHAYTDNSAYAWTHGVKDADDDIVFSGFNLPEIPGDATIDSVVIEMNYRVSNTRSAAVVSMQALHGSTPMGTGRSSSKEPTSWTKINTPNNGTWTIEQINDGTLAVRVRVHRTGVNDTPYYGLDYVKVLVTYTTEVDE